MMRSLRVQANTPSTSEPALRSATVPPSRAGESAAWAGESAAPRAPAYRWAGMGSSCTVSRMPPLQWECRPDGLRAPALICAFKGWNDAADAASTALTFIAGTLGAQRFATIDPEEFYDFQATRPSVQLVGGETREIVWPTVELFEARVPRAPRDLILLVGTEPSMRWRTFTGVVV